MNVWRFRRCLQETATSAEQLLQSDYAYPESATEAENRPDAGGTGDSDNGVRG
jgi:hypothetical protein